MSLIAIDEIRKDLLIGIVAGFGLIVANILGLFSLALPPQANLFATNVGRLAIVVLVAPILEEVFFRGVMFRFFQQSSNSKIIALFGQAIIFGLFHLVAYSGVVLEAFEIAPVLAVGGAFLSAIIFGIVASLLVQRTNNLLPAMIMHAMINFSLVRGTLVIV